MSQTTEEPIRILIVDDETGVLDVYREILCPPDTSAQDAARGVVSSMRARLFPSKNADPAPVVKGPLKSRFEINTVTSAEAAVEAVKVSLAINSPYALIFLDMRMPPGRDGAWAAEQIRALDENVSIVLCSAYSDVDTEELSRRIAPEDKFFFLAKPFHPQEVRQMALALGHKWRAERRIAQLAYYDTLTGLPNREQFRDRFRVTLDSASRNQRPVALLYIDLDNFKRINDTLGHTAGDELLQVMAERLRDAIRKSDDVIHVSAIRRRGNDCARLGGDEFMALLPEVMSAGDASIIADRIVKVMSQPVPLGGQEVTVSPSIGIAIYPQDGDDAETLLRNADLAMYSAKRAAPGTFAFYDAQMNATAARQLEIETQLRTALINNEMTLSYQPQFELETGIVSSVEALLRWTNPILGCVPPMEFIPMAEATGLILPIGEWVLRTACTQAKRWADQGLLAGRMAVNVSALQFAQKDFVETVASILEETGLPAACLELELTETLVMKDEAWAYQVLRRLKTLGVDLAIDDFGTGYSSFSRLKEFPVDRLKIDRSFIRRTEGGADEDDAIISAMINMAKTLGLGVVAEGVEELPQLLFLQEQKCDLGQGYLLGMPLNVQSTEDFLERMRQTRESSNTQRIRTLVG